MNTTWDDYKSYWSNHFYRTGPRYFVTGMEQAEYNLYYGEMFSYFHDREVKTVFDLGCGTGMMIPLMNQLYPGVRYVGLDISGPAIEYNREMFPDYEWVLMTSPTLPGKADLILVISVFTHIKLEDTGEYLDVIREALNPGGRAIISIHVNSEQGAVGSIPRVDIEPACFEDLLAEHGFKILCWVEGIQRYYEVEPC